MNTERMIDAIKGIDPDSAAFWSHIGGLFGLMEVAEDEIVKAQTRHPEAKEKLWDTFRLMQPGILLGFPDRLYRAHCRELLERVYHDEDARPGTRAECLVIFSETSQIAPLRHNAVMAMSRLFTSLFPEQAAHWDVVPVYESHAGAANEVLAWTQKKAAIATRRY